MSSMNQKSFYEPTDEEKKHLDRAGMAAALDELRLLSEDADSPVSSDVRICLRAFKAARIAANAARNELLDTKPGFHHISYFPEIDDMVCSAMAAHLLGLDADECSPRSVAGYRILILFKAAKALEAMSNLYSALDDSDEIFGTCFADETAALAEAEIKR